MKEYYIKINEKKTEVDWKELIQKARDLSYESPAGVYTTSEAANFLREHGYEVGCNK